MRKKCQIFLLLALFCILCIIPKAVSAAEKEYNLNKKKTVTISASDSYGSSGNSAWLKYKPAADGYLTLKMSDPANATTHANGYIALYNQTKGTALSSKSIFYNTQHSKNAYWHTFTFGLQKGQTYYLRIRGENAVKISRKFTKTKDKSGATQEAALGLKKNKAKKGLIPAGVSNADWYKITLSKKQKIKIYYNVRVSGTGGCFKISVYSNKKLLTSRNIYYTSKESRYTLCNEDRTTKKTTGMDAGTYYIKIERANSASSGYYKIKWQ